MGGPGPPRRMGRVSSGAGPDHPPAPLWPAAIGDPGPGLLAPDPAPGGARPRPLPDSSSGPPGSLGVGWGRRKAGVALAPAPGKGPTSNPRWVPTQGVGVGLYPDPIIDGEHHPPAPWASGPPRLKHDQRAGLPWPPSLTTGPGRGSSASPDGVATPPGPKGAQTHPTQRAGGLRGGGRGGPPRGQKPRAAAPPGPHGPRAKGPGPGSRRKTEP